MVYLITDGTYTKIGKASNGISGVKRRLNELQTGNAKKLSIKNVFEGTYELENLLHRSLSKYRMEGEWFDISFDIDDEMIEMFKSLYSIEKSILNSKRIGVSESNRIRGLKTKENIVRIIDDLLITDKFIKNKDIAERLSVATRTVGKIITSEQKELIKKHNKKISGYTSLSDVVKNRNINKIKKCINNLKKEKKKVSYVSISKETGIHRASVSKICKKYNLK